LLTATVCCIVAQRLVRVLCRSCREPYQIGARQAEDIGLASGSTLYRARGCEACRGSGYVWSIGLYEVMALGDGLRKAVHERVDGRELHGLAIAGGMRWLQSRELLPLRTRPHRPRGGAFAFLAGRETRLTGRIRALITRQLATLI